MSASPDTTRYFSSVNTDSDDVSTTTDFDIIPDTPSYHSPVDTEMNFPIIPETPCNSPRDSPDMNGSPDTPMDNDPSVNDCSLAAVPDTISGKVILHLSRTPERHFIYMRKPSTVKSKKNIGTFFRISAESSSSPPLPVRSPSPPHLSPIVAVVPATPRVTGKVTQKPPRPTRRSLRLNRKHKQKSM